MKSGTIPLAIFFALCILGGIVWIGRGPSLPVDRPPEPPPDNGLEIPEKGPYPKAVAEKAEYDFGVMEVTEDRKHRFVIRNEGEALLKLKKGTSTCKCTVSELARTEIPVGESVEVEVTWRPTSLSEAFEQRVTIETNDPENKLITLKVRGRVEEAVVLRPAEGWNLGTVSEDEPMHVSGVLYSPIYDKFEVLGIESSNELLTGKAVPMTEEELKKAKAKSGYNIEVTLATGLKVGPFRERLTIRTDVENEKTFSAFVNARREGPISILAFGGVKWYPEANLLELGKFSARDGRKAKLDLFVGGLGDGDLKLLDVQANPQFLNVNLAPYPGPAVGGRKHYCLTFEVPAGKPPVTYLGKSAAKVVVKTNHPDAEEIKFRIRFVSLG